MYFVKHQQFAELCIEGRWFKGEGGKRRLQSRQVRWGLNSSSDLHGWWDDWEAGKEPDVKRGPQGKVPLSCPPLCCRVAFSTPSGPAWRGQCCCGAVFSLVRAGSRENPTEREIASSGRTGASGVATAQLDGTPWELRRLLIWSSLGPTSPSLGIWCPPSSARPVTCCFVHEGALGKNHPLLTVWSMPVLSQRCSCIFSRKIHNNLQEQKWVPPFFNNTTYQFIYLILCWAYLCFHCAKIHIEFFTFDHF